MGTRISQLTLLCRLFLLAARQSVQAPSALAPQRRFLILNFQFNDVGIWQKRLKIRVAGLALFYCGCNQSKSLHICDCKSTTKI